LSFALEMGAWAFWSGPLARGVLDSDKNYLAPWGSRLKAMDEVKTTAPFLTVGVED